MKFSETQRGVLGTVTAVTIALVVFLFHGEGVIAGPDSVRTWGVYVDTWFLVVVLVGILAGIVVLAFRMARRKRVG